jgi:hypothetical protein
MPTDIWFTGQAVLPSVGLQPSVRVTPTLAGVRAGEDEVMQAAVELLVSERGAAVR